MASPGTWHDDDPSRPVAISHAKRAWASAARPILERVARSYNATITYQQLADEVRDATGFRTRMLVHYWIGDVLRVVVRNCHDHGEPLLSSLCVDATGSVGDGYGAVLRDLYRTDPPEDLDMHAAVERLKCYRHFGAELPPDGGSPTLTTRLAAKRTWQRREAERTAPRPVCPTCHLQLPATGRCDNCE